MYKDKIFSRGVKAFGKYGFLKKGLSKGSGMCCGSSIDDSLLNSLYKMNVSARGSQNKPSKSRAGKGMKGCGLSFQR